MDAVGVNLLHKRSEGTEQARLSVARSIYSLICLAGAVGVVQARSFIVVQRDETLVEFRARPP